MDAASLLPPITGVLGLIIGSFANVCVHRIPKHESIVFPSSRCPACAHSIAWYDNIPLVSWLALGGKCRHCNARIAFRYPLLELIMGVTWAGLAWHFGPSVQLLMAIVLCTLLWVLTFIDLETGLLPDVLTLPGIGLGIGFGIWFGHFTESLLGALLGYGVFWLVARLFLLVTGREGMGYGDFKLLAILGAFFGWQALPFVIFVSACSGAVVGSAYLILSRKQMRAEIPFGPYLAVAGMIWLVWGQQIWDWYLGLMRF
jgi:leader peptidase (prepilin peptidase)/N-methyltransferase